MPHCPKCNADYITGELFCPACGHALPASTLWPPHAPEAPPKEPEARKEQPEARKQESTAHQNQPAAQPYATSNGASNPPHLRLQLPSGTIIDLQGRETTLIGRKDVDADPDVDLTPYGGLEKGVSRKHAMIIFDDGRYYIKDMESTNYTLLNSARLFPQQLYPLKHQDHLTLGDLEITILL